MTTVRLWAIAAALALVPSAPAAVSYDDHTTHATMTDRAIVLAWPSGYGEIRAYKDAIRKGAIKEDSGEPIIRFNNHFFDPSTGLGMPRNSYTVIYEGNLSALGGTTRYKSAYEWGLNQMPDDMDWEGAIDAYGYGPNATSYEALGHVVHLLQDMAQPDHARCRPHPGGYVHDTIKSKLGERVAEYLCPSNRIGYEKLWKLMNEQWPWGKIARKPTSLNDAFRTLASEAKAAEDALGLLQRSKGERALGLRSYRAARLDPGGMGREAVGEVLTTTLDNLSALWRADQYLEFEDGLWRDFEVDCPIVPMIPWPANLETKPYIELGNQLLPLAEERSAGLLQLFHDIVNHPPIVQRVQIQQKGELKYDKRWDNTPEGRTLVAAVESDVKLGTESEITVSFGPLWNDPDRVKTILDINVFLEIPGGESLPIPGRVTSATGQNVTWAGSITPQKFGTLRIEARDGTAHFENRNFKGDLLDSNPATFALARSPQPYHWVGYEPGPDRNHRLSARSGCGVCLEVGRLEKTFVSGTYTGRVHRKRTLNDGGLEETEADLTCRVLRVGYSWDRADQKNAVILGHATGNYTLKFRADSRKPIETSTGGPIQLGGAIHFHEPCDAGQGHRYSIQVDFPDYRRGQGFFREAIVQDGLDLAGRTVGDDGAQYTWNLAFKPAPAPAHFAPAGSVNPGNLGLFLGNYTRQAWETLSPGLTKLSLAGRPSDLQAVQDRMTEPTDAFSRSGDTLAGIQNGIIEHYHAAEKSWITLGPKEQPDEKYRAAVSALTAAMAQWTSLKKENEARYAAATLDVARKIEPADKDCAKNLRALAEKLKTKGCEAFGDSGR